MAQSVQEYILCPFFCTEYSLKFRNHPFQLQIKKSYDRCARASVMIGKWHTKTNILESYLLHL